MRKYGNPEFKWDKIRKEDFANIRKDISGINNEMDIFKTDLQLLKKFREFCYDFFRKGR